jgi:hypothetical protein
MFPSYHWANGRGSSNDKGLGYSTAYYTTFVPTPRSRIVQSQFCYDLSLKTGQFREGNTVLCRGPLWVNMYDFLDSGQLLQHSFSTWIRSPERVPKWYRALSLTGASGRLFFFLRSVNGYHWSVSQSGPCTEMVS